MSDQEPTDEHRVSGRRVLSGALTGVVLAGGCIALTSGGDDTDTSAEAACGHFRNVVQDARMLNDAELREKLLEVESSASGSESIHLRAAARGMVEEITRGTETSFVASAERFETACGRLGY